MDTVLMADGTRIAYQRTGTGPPLVLMHGTLDDHGVWSRVMPELRNHVTLYAVDRRGHGGSGPVDAGTYAIGQEVEDILAVVDAIGAPVSLLGHSYGALCAMEAALRAGNLHRLILYEPPIPILPEFPIVPPGALEDMERMLAAGDREGVVLYFLREIAQAPPEAVSALRSSPQWEVATGLARSVLCETRAVSRYLLDEGRIRGLEIPTLLLVGSESPRFLTVATGALHAALPQSSLVTLTGQGHLAMATSPNQFLGPIIPFLTQDAGMDSVAVDLANVRH